MDEVELRIFQIPQAAVNELRVLSAGPGGEMILFDKGNADPRIAQNQIARNARPVDSAADNEHVELLVSQLREIALAHVTAMLPPPRLPPACDIPAAVRRTAPR